MNRILTAAVLLSLASCGSSPASGDDPASSPGTPTVNGQAVPGATLSSIAGQWTSAERALGDGRIVQLDVTSSGQYAIGVVVRGTPDRMVEAGVGSLELAGNTLSSTPEPSTRPRAVGSVVTGLGNWAAVLGSDGKSMMLSGIDGKRLSMRWLRR